MARKEKRERMEMGERRMERSERREHRMDRQDNGRWDGAQPVGEKEAGVFGRRHNMGIQFYDVEAEKEPLTPLKNKFSWMECSQDEAMRAVRGKGTSYEASGRYRDRAMTREEY